MPRFVARLVAFLTFALAATTLQVALPAAAEAKVWKVPNSDLSLDPLLNLTEYETRVVNLINKKRKARDLKPVNYFQGCVDRMAERWAAHLMDIGELVHRDQRKVLARCDLHWAGETLVSGTSLLPAEAVKAWMNSPDHKAVIMKPRANRAGVGFKVNLAGKVVGVLNFGDTR